MSDGIDEMGPAKWDLVLCLLFAWIVVYACICQGIRSSGKVTHLHVQPWACLVILIFIQDYLDYYSMV